MQADIKDSALKVYRFAFIGLIGFISLGQFFFQYSANEVKLLGEVINIAGRQRMLSQTLPKYVSEYELTKSKESLIKVNEIFKKFKEGNEFLTKTEDVNSNTYSQFIRTSILYQKISEKIYCLNTVCQSVNNFMSIIKEDSKMFLLEMEELVKAYEIELNASVSMLSKISLFTYLLTIIFVLFIFYKALIPVLNTLKNKITDLYYLKNQYEDVQSLSKTGGWELDLKTSKTLWSKEIYNIHALPLGKSPDKVDAISFFAPHERERLMNAIDVCVNKKKGYDLEFEFFDNNGVKKWVRAVGKPVLDDDGNVYKLIGTFQDISEKKELERSLIHSAKLASIGQLAAGVGHEINNPLAIIKGYINVTLSKEDLPESMKETLVKIDKAGDRIANIVKGLRSFSRVESEMSDKNIFSLQALLYEIENMIKEIYAKDGVILNFNFEALSEEICVEGDRGKLEQVLMNLINNSRDATEGQAERIIHIDAELQQDLIELKVSDNGPGIPIEIRDKIFEPFYTTKEVGKGTGIGLSLSHKLIHNDLKGKLVLENKELGTCFRIELPIIRMEFNTQA